MSKLLGVACAVVLGITLSLGLWPFHSPRNDVAWLRGRAGLAFGDSSFAVSSRPLPPPSDAAQGFTVEIWAQPRRIWDRATLLAFWDPGAPTAFSLRQSQLDLEVRVRERDRDRPATFTFARIFPRKGPVFVTLASGLHGTAVYVDGRLRESIASLRLPADALTGRIVLGDAPRQTDSWRGQLFGAAIYRRELGEAEIGRHFWDWTRGGRPEADPAVAALYLLNERAGSVIHSAASPGPDLEIPEKYTVLDQIFLNPFWREFELTRSYGSAALKNVVGFLPVGFCFYPWFLSLRLKRPMLAAVAVGTAISITIEVVQVFLPTRDSGTTDLFTNTFGTWLGVVLYDRVRRTGLVPAAIASRLPEASPDRHASAIP